MGEEREPHFREEVPQGYCKQGCRAPDGSLMPLIKQGNVTVCPQHEISSPPSGLVNEFDDPGHEAMEKVLKSITPKDLPNVKVIEQTIGKLGEAGAKMMDKIFVDKIRSFPTYENCLNYVQNLPMPNNMRDIKKILKIKQLLTELVQGENNG